MPSGKVVVKANARDYHGCGCSFLPTPQLGANIYWRPNRYGSALIIPTTDLSYVLRGLVRRPAVPALVVLVLAIGIGASTSVFSVLDHIFFRLPSGVRAPQELRRLYAIRQDPSSAQARSAFTVPEYQDAARAVTAPAEIAAYLRRDGTAFAFGAIEGRMNTAWVSDGFFTLTAPQFVRGRPFLNEEGRFGDARNVVVVSFDFWRRALGQRSNEEEVHVKPNPFLSRCISPSRARRYR